MALQECRLNLNQKLKELRPHGTLEFPCAGYSSYYTGRQEGQHSVATGMKRLRWYMLQKAGWN